MGNNCYNPNDESVAGEHSAIQVQVTSLCPKHNLYAAPKEFMDANKQLPYQPLSRRDSDGQKKVKFRLPLVTYI